MKVVGTVEGSLATALALLFSCVHFLLVFTCHVLLHLAYSLKKPCLYMLQLTLGILAPVFIIIYGLMFAYGSPLWLPIFFFVAFAVAIDLAILQSSMTSRAYQLARFPNQGSEQRGEGQKELKL